MVKTLFLEVMMSSKEDEDEMSFKDECKSKKWGKISQREEELDSLMNFASNQDLIWHAW